MLCLSSSTKGLYNLQKITLIFLYNMALIIIICIKFVRSNNMSSQQLPSELNTLKKELDYFIHKYHTAQLYRGLFLVGGLFLATILFASLAEYYGRFGTLTRTILFFSVLLFFVILSLNYIAKPLVQLFNSKKYGLNYQHASVLIGTHFPEVGDKLLNALQLGQQVATTPNNELLFAAINQKSAQLSHIPFVQAINWKEVQKVARYSVVPIALILIVLLTKSSLFFDGGHRLLRFQQQFVAPAPYTFHFENMPTQIFKNQDLEVNLILKGKDIPEEMFIVSGGNRIKMKSVKNAQFAYVFKNAQKDVTFYFSDGKHLSQNFQITVVPKPILHKMSVQLDYPLYLKKTNERLDNTNTLFIPEGTLMTWTFKTKDAQEVIWGKNVLQKSEKYTDQFEYSEIIKTDTKLQLYVKNTLSGAIDSMPITLNVVYDEHPKLFSQSMQDSTQVYVYYIFGEAIDDYGISKMSLFYKSDPKENFKEQKIQAKETGNRADFFMPINLNDYGITGENTLTYYIQAWDNDGVNGPKSVRSPVYELKRVSDKLLAIQTEEAGKALVSKMNSSLEKMSALQEKIKAIEKEIIQKDKLTWEDKQKIEKLLEEQKQLQEELKQLQEENKKRNQLEDQYKSESESIKQKQEQLQKLFDELIDEKTKEMMDKLQQMLQEQQKDKLKDQLNKLNKENKDLEKMLDKALEQFKQLELEKKINETSEKLNDLAKEQEQLKKETLEAEKSEKQDLLNKQAELNKQFEDIKKDLQDISQKNKNLENPLNMENQEAKADEIKEEMNDAADKIKDNKKKNAADKQQSAADKMKEMAEKMKDELEKNQDAQQEEDYQTLRLLLKNLVLLSQNQEEILKEFKDIRDYNPRYITLANKQKELRGLSKSIEDSLTALAKRQPMVSNYVSTETSSLVYQMEGAIEHLSDRNTYQATVKQQYAMMHANNLAVFLTDVLKNMQEQMKESKSKDKKKQEGEPNASCDNPGKGDLSKSKPKPGMQGMQQLQDKLNKMMEDMQGGMQNGKMPSSEEFAKIAAQQEAMRKQLEKIEKGLREQGEGGSDLAKEIAKTKEMMEETETQLYNKQLDAKTMKRQRDISHRMFEHEKAEREQGEDEKRKGETATAVERKMPPSLEKYLKEKQKEVEFYRTLPPEFTPYYKERVKSYYEKLQVH